VFFLFFGSINTLKVFLKAGAKVQLLFLSRKCFVKFFLKIFVFVFLPLKRNSLRFHPLNLQ